MGTPDPKAKTNGHVFKTPPPPTDLLSQDSAYAKRHRKLLDQLIAIGIEKVIDVPKVVVVGSQSAGKSSILEALSGITFPRASGTCTRCPSEVRLFSSNDDWVCTVSLRIEKDRDGNRLDKVRVVPFGSPITDSSKVQLRLLQAQRAILNPTMAPESFLQVMDAATKAENGSDEDVKAVNEVQFSENVICIDVKGKNVPDLAVVDLPGLIANVGENEDERNIELIKNLAKKEIAKENCIILLCITMNEDFQNQPSVTLAKEADPSGKRTLGVLTKPDRIEEGTFGNWKPVLEGKEQKLLHGYYVVKNPDPKQLGQLTWEQARANEKAYFQKDPWASLGSTITSRLGSSNLATKLSTLLEQIIKARMPSIMAEVKALHEQVQKELEFLPKQVPEGQMLNHLSSLIRNFDDEMKWAILESQERESLADDIYNISLDFWADMINQRPRFLPLTKSEVEKLQALKSVDRVSGLQELMNLRDHVFEEDKAELKARGVLERKGLSNGQCTELIPLLLDPTKCTTKYGSHSLDYEIRAPVMLLTLSDISSIKARATRDLLPNNTPWSVKAKLIEMCVKNWSGCTTQALKKIEARVMSECEVLIKKHFSRFQVGGLENMISRILENLIAERAEKTRAFVSDLVKLETRYTTVGTDNLVKRQGKLMKALADAREQVDIHYQYRNTHESLTDKVDDELSLISEIRAYWQIAFKRYTDNVRSAFYTIFLQPIAADCLDTLTSELGIFDEDATSKVKSLLQEDQDTVQRRTELLAKQATLSLSLEVIKNFWSGALKVNE